MASGKRQTKVKRVMHEFKTGALSSSSGKKVKSRKQAIAIAMSESGQSRKKPARASKTRTAKSDARSTTRKSPARATRRSTGGKTGTARKAKD